jgi:hypothetical protein
MKMVRLSAVRTGRLGPPGNISDNNFDPRAIVRPKGLCEQKIPMSGSGIEPVTLRFAAQCLNQLRRRVPPMTKVEPENILVTLTFKWF